MGKPRKALPSTHKGAAPKDAIVPGDLVVLGQPPDCHEAFGCLVGAAIAIGGNVRVGLEDNFYVAPGKMAKSNGELVEKAVKMIRDQGREVAGIEETRKRLKLKNR